MKISFIGAGNMARALIFGMTDEMGISPSDIGICDVDKSAYGFFNERGFKTFPTNAEAAAFGEIIFIAVKPNNFTTLALENADLTGKTVVSVAAGITIAYIQSLLPAPAAIIRTMPNTPLLIGEGMTAMCRNALVSDAAYAAVTSIFSSLGEVAHMPEDRMNAVISVNASSPAYAYAFVRAMVRGAVAQGFTEAEAYPIAAKAFAGAVKMMEGGSSPDDLIRAVKSPNGTTAAALDSFETDGLEAIVARAMAACTRRADEMTREYCGI